MLQHFELRVVSIYETALVGNLSTVNLRRLIIETELASIIFA